MNEIVLNPEFLLDETVYIIGNFSSERIWCKVCDGQGCIQVKPPHAKRSYGICCPACDGEKWTYDNFKDVVKTRIKKIEISISELGIDYEYFTANESRHWGDDKSIYKTRKLAKEALKEM